MGPVQWVAVVVIVVTVAAVARGVDVRLALFLGALALAGLVGDPPLVVRTFLETFSAEKFVVPICSAMGFAYVLRHTGCDQHLVRLLTAPLRHVRFLLVPGVVLVGFVVNVPVISQTSTAVCLGPVVVPLMRAAGFRPAVIGACLALGASVGGELLNPGAPELLTVRAKTGIETKELAWKYVLPLLVPYVAAAALAFWVQAEWEERKRPTQSPPVATGGLSPADSPGDRSQGVNYLKALVPLVPLALLFLTGPPLNLVDVPQRWLVARPSVEAVAAVTGTAAAAHAEAKPDEKAGSRLIGAAMLVGVFAAAAAAPGRAKDCAKQFFEGAGYGFAVIVSLIVTANCFGKAIERVGLADALGDLIAGAPGLLVPLAAAVPWAFAAVSGSGMASTQSLYGFFHGPAVELGQDPAAVGAVVSVGSAAGRTMSPVAAVVLMSATLTGVKPFDVVKRVAGPLMFGLVVTVTLRVTGVV
jgi:DcuC family C4-dicarboxylate transporter